MATIDPRTATDNPDEKNFNNANFQSFTFDRNTSTAPLTNQPQPEQQLQWGPGGLLGCPPGLEYLAQLNQLIVHAMPGSMVNGIL